MPEVAAAQRVGERVEFRCCRQWQPRQVPLGRLVGLRLGVRTRPVR